MFGLPPNLCESDRGICSLGIEAKNNTFRQAVYLTRRTIIALAWWPCTCRMQGLLLDHALLVHVPLAGLVFWGLGRVGGQR